MIRQPFNERNATIELLCSADAREPMRNDAGHVSSGTQLIEKIMKITKAARAHQLAETAAAAPEPVEIKAAAAPVEPQGRLASALQQLAMRPGIGGRAA